MRLQDPVLGASIAPDLLAGGDGARYIQYMPRPCYRSSASIFGPFGLNPLLELQFLATPIWT